MNNRIQFTEVLKTIIEKHGLDLYDDSQKLKAFLMDYMPNFVAERNLLISAVDAGVFDIINSCTDENKELCFKKAKFTLQDNLFIEESIAEYIVYSIAYSLNLCTLNEVKEILEKAILDEEQEKENSCNSGNAVRNPSNNVRPKTTPNPSNSNPSPNPPVNPYNPHNGQNAPANTFTNFFKNKIAIGIACGVLLVGACFAGYNLIGSGGVSGSGIVISVPYEAKGIPIYSDVNPFSKPINLLSGKQKVTILDKKICKDDIYVLNGEYGLLKIGSSFERITGNKTIFFKVKKESVNPNRLYQKGSLIQYYDEKGLVDAFVGAIPSQISRIGDSIKGKEIYKIKLEDGTVGWIYSGFVHLDNKEDANRTEKETVNATPTTAPAPVSKVEEKLNDYIIEKNKNGQEIRQLSYSIENWGTFTNVNRMELKNSATSAKAKLVGVRNKYQSQYKEKADYSETLLKIFNKEIEIYDAFIMIADTGDRDRVRELERLYNEYLLLERKFKQEK